MPDSELRNYYCIFPADPKRDYAFASLARAKAFANEQASFLGEPVRVVKVVRSLEYVASPPSQKEPKQ